MINSQCISHDVPSLCCYYPSHEQQEADECDAPSQLCMGRTFVCFSWVWKRLRTGLKEEKWNLINFPTFSTFHSINKWWWETNKNWFFNYTRSRRCWAIDSWWECKIYAGIYACLWNWWHKWIVNIYDMHATLARRAETLLILPSRSW